MQQNLPFNFKEVFKLTNLGLNPDLFKFGSVTFESQKYICIKDQADCAIIDTTKNFALERKPMKAEGILMHRSKNIIALRATQGAKTVIQVFNLDTKAKVKQCEVNEPIRFWRWIEEDVLGIVGQSNVYHTDINSTDAPQKVFEQEAKFGKCQIMNYGIDTSKKWCYLIGIYQGANNTICCHMQLFFIEKRQQQILEGFAATFTDMPVTDANTYKNSLFCFCEKKAGENVQKLHIMEIGNPAPNQPKFKKSADIQMQQDGDFPVLMQDCPKYGVLFIITKFGFLYMYEVSSASLLFRQKITDQLCFVSTRNANTDGMIVVNRVGQIFSINVEENNLIPYINSAGHIPDNKNLSFKLAQRFHLSGADDLFMMMFNQKLAAGDYAGAATVARDAPGTLLRNQETINKFKNLPQTGGPAPILIYFNALLQTTKLNAIESIELARPVIQQNKLNLIENWIKEQKLTMTDELGDLIRQANPQLALNIYQQSGSPDKVIQGLIETNQLDKIMPYCEQTGHVADFVKIMRQILPINPQAAVGLAKMVTNRDSGPPKAQADLIVNVFLEFNKIQECTAFLLEALKNNRADEGHLQTKVLEINLMSAPNVAEGIFKLNILSHYDREKVAKMCEQIGLYGRALQNYSSMADIKRVILNTHAIPEEQIIEFFGKLGEEESLQCMYDMLKSNRQNAMMVAKIGVKYANKIDTKKCIEVLESFGTNEGMLYYLANVLPHTEDPDIFFKYIEACARLGNFKEVERVIRETSNYDPVKVKDFLMDAKLPDPRPLIYLCDMHKFIDELTRYLYNNKQNKFIEIYLFKVNPNATPKVLGTLLELDSDEIYIKQLLNSIRVCPIPELVDEFEQRGKLRMLQNWLESRNDERIQEPALHNALAMIYIDINKDPQNFLINNQYYDSKVVGKYCEERNPDLAFTAYKRAWGECDEELIEVTNKNYLYRMQARYLVERQNEELWAKVLNPENTHRKSVIDQVVQTALPESKNADEVSCAVKTFLAADLPHELIELLERIVLHNTGFANNENLQNLLVLTAIKSDHSKVMDYVNRLDNFDGVELAKIAQDDQYKLYDEALCIYKKFNEHVEAVKILLHKQNNIRQAQEYSEKINKPEVFTELGKAQLDQNMIKDAMESFIKANNPSMYMMVVNIAQTQDCFEELIQFLIMARKTLKQQVIDSELIFSYAKCGEKYLGEMENFIADPNQADIQKVGEKCFDHKLYAAAKILFTKIGNNQKLAQVYVMLREFQQAYDAAKKADIPKVWKAVCFSCVRAKEFNFAQRCGLNIIIQPDHLEDLIQHYEKFGYYDELISLLEQGLNHERTHNGISTDLGIMYAKHQPHRLADHIRSHHNRLHIPKLIRACEQQQMWPETVQLHQHYDQWDHAISTMIEHSPSAFRHDIFSISILKVTNHDLYYKSMIFYLEEEPMLLGDLLKLIGDKIDLNKCVTVMKRTGYISLIEPFLRSVQPQNVAAVNEALNEIYLEKLDYSSLRQSIKDFDSFESITLAQDLETHDLLDCRRISALLYRKNKRYQKSIDISKNDKLYKDAMETVAESKDSALAEDLMRFIMEMEDKELFAAMLYTCYELIKPDVALEVAWRSDLMEFVMPYFIQFVKDLSTRVETVQKSTDDIKKKEDKKKEERLEQPLDMNVEMMFPGMGGMGGMPQVQAIMPAPGMMGMTPPGGFQPQMGMPQQNMGMNMGMGQQTMGMGQQNMGMGGMNQGQNPFGGAF